MSAPGPAPAPAAAAADAGWGEASLVAVLLAIDPVGIGGVRLRAAADARRDAWLATLRAALPPGAPLLRMPLHIADERLLGGIDLGATLRSGRVVAQPGLLARCDGGVLLVAMAERLSAPTAARLAAVLDTQEVAVQREGLNGVMPAHLGVVALDESVGDDESVPAALTERLGIEVDLRGFAIPARDLAPPDDGVVQAAEVGAARARLARVAVDDASVELLCETAEALGVASLRAPIFALRLARAAAAWAGRSRVEVDDVALAARWVLAPRATRLPAPPEAGPQDEAPPPPPVPPDSDEAPPDDEASERPENPSLQDQVLQSALAAIPPGLLAMLLSGRRTRSAAGGRAGALQASRLRGRPCGSRRGDPRGGARLHLIDTLRAAAPWQALRAREHPQGPRVRVRREDFHVARFLQRRETTTVFVVDASGSAALHRLAEAKGAVELLLAECYVRRDRVALIAFRGTPGSIGGGSGASGGRGGGGAELLLPPTRSLVRVKRCLAALPGGGGTPLAAGLDAARELAEDIARRGGTPVVVLLTDGRANIARDGTPGRTRAAEDALAAARSWPALGLGALWLDTSPQPQAQAQQLALAMGARYLPLPHADARQMSQAVRAAAASSA